MAVSPNPGTEVPCGADVQAARAAARQRTAWQSCSPDVSSAQFVPALNPLSNMLFQHEAEAPLQTALVDRVDNAQSHACRTSPDGQEVRQGSGPCPVGGTPG